MNRQFSPKKRLADHLKRQWFLQAFLGAVLFLSGFCEVFGANPKESPWKDIEPYFSPPKEWAAKYGDYVSPLRFKDGSMVTSATACVATNDRATLSH